MLKLLLDTFFITILYIILTIKVDYKKYLFGSKILTEISKSTIWEIYCRGYIWFLFFIYIIYIFLYHVENSIKRSIIIFVYVDVVDLRWKKLQYYVILASPKHICDIQTIIFFTAKSMSQIHSLFQYFKTG